MHSRWAESPHKGGCGVRGAKAWFTWHRRPFLSYPRAFAMICTHCKSGILHEMSCSCREHSGCLRRRRIAQPSPVRDRCAPSASCHRSAKQRASTESLPQALGRTQRCGGTTGGTTSGGSSPTCSHAALWAIGGVCMAASSRMAPMRWPRREGLNL